FGVFKRRFNVVAAAMEYSQAMQIRLVAAFGALHNFIRIHEPRTGNTSSVHQSGPDGVEREQAAKRNTGAGIGELGGFISETEQTRAKALRNAIAQAMWDDYVEYV
ncbi:hypothetical protein BDZ89DRAFT_903489, partial [Hymenopellis radicata]